MSSFTRFNTNLKMEFIGPDPKNTNRVLFKLTEGFTFYLEDPDGDCVEVHHGFITDGASVPQVFWSLLPPWGSYGQAAVLHDYLLEGGRIQSHRLARRVDRKTARAIFNEAMKVLEVPSFTRRLMIFGVWIWDVVKRNKINPRLP